MTKIDKVIEYIKENGGIIHEAPEGKVWLEYAGRNLRGKNVKVAIDFAGYINYGKTIELAIIAIHKAGRISLYDFGYDTCPKCTGTGKVWSSVHGGVCFKCRGFGVIER